jgi:hypothetical protein
MEIPLHKQTQSCWNGYKEGMLQYGNKFAQNLHGLSYEVRVMNE